MGRLPLNATPPIVRTLETRDFDEMAQSFSRWDHRFEQLNRGRFDGRITFVDFGGVQVFDVTTNVAIRCRGTRLPDSYTFSLIESANADSLWRGRLLRPGMINVCAPAHETDHRTNRDYRHTAITIRRDLLESMTPILLGIDLQALVAVDPAVEVDVRRADVFINRLRSVIHMLDFNSSELTLGLLVTDLLRTLSSGRIVDPFRATPADRLRVVREAEDFARSMGLARVRVAQLCERTRVSERTLHYAFVEVTGLPPRAYFKTVRLNQVRKELAIAPPGRGQVAAIALRHGFDRPGKFAADFRRLFGELPTDILAARGS
jgi:AraC family ethanolamine operon transcriptional activator